MNINSPNSKMTVAPPMAQMVHTMLAQALFGPPSLSASFARAERQCGQRGDGDGRAERHGEGGGHARPEQPLRQREDENEDRAGARPDADREHDGHHLAPGDRAGKLPRVDHVIARLPRRMMVMVMVMMMVAVVVVLVMMVGVAVRGNVLAG